MRSRKQYRADKPSWLIRGGAIAGLAFMHIPVLIIILYAFTTEDRTYQFPPPGFTLRWFQRAFERAVAILTRNRPALERAAKRLLEKETLEENELRLYDALRNEARHIDDLAEEAGLPAAAASALLLTMELKGLVRNHGAQYYVLR